MTQLEYLNIIRAIETVEDNEKIHCKGARACSVYNQLFATGCFDEAWLHRA